MNRIYEPISNVLTNALAQFKKNPAREILFVFPTEIEKMSWIDWALKNQSESGVEGVQLEQFIAWDRFKAEFAAAENARDGKSCVPALLRKVFAQDILKENSKSHFLKRIISRDTDENSIFVFTDWLSKILPSLKLWEKHYKFFLEKVKKNEAADDEENHDLSEILFRYSDFLEQHDFYEPSFLNIDFNSRGKQVFIFYPEINEDFGEYIDSLAKSDDVTIISVPDFATNAATDTGGEKPLAIPIQSIKPSCILYPDARMELRRLALKIRQLWQSGVDLRTIAVNIPNLDEIRPYIEREFSLYSIPFAIRDGIEFTRNSGGDVFTKIKDCLDTRFSFEAMRALLTDGFLPWKDSEINLRLIQAGAKLRCVCPSNEGDSWEISLANAARKGGEEYSGLLLHYKKIKSAIEKFSEKNCASFDALKSAWEAFRDEFIDTIKFKSIWQREMEEAQQRGDELAKNALLQIEPDLQDFDLTDKILGQMITMLSEFSDCEKDFFKKFKKKFALNNYLDFYINEIQQKKYNPNSKEYGVNIFSYKVAACADFEYQFVLNASQSDINIQLKPLPFISDEAKRANFSLEQNDVSAKFIALYSAQNRAAIQKQVFFSSAKVNFDGAAIPHTALEAFDLNDFIEEVESAKFDKKNSDKIGEKTISAFEKFDYKIRENKVVDCLDEFDFVKNELSPQFAQWQKSAFENWRETKAQDKKETPLSEPLKNKIDRYLSKEESGISISASKLNSYFTCPRSMLLQNIIEISDEKFSPRLAEANEIGNLYHKILELALRGFGKRLPVFSDEERGEVESIARCVLEEALNDKEIAAFDMSKSALAYSALQSQKPTIIRTMTNFLLKLCAAPEDGKSGSYGGYTIEGVEIERTVFGKIFGCHGRIDCLLSQNNDPNRAVIIDYKSGRLPTSTECKIDKDGKIKNLQMAMYVYLLENEGSQQKQYKIQDALFYSLREKDEDFKLSYIIQESNKKATREEYEATMNVFKEYLEEFSQKASGYDFSISGNFSDKNYVNANTNCSQCRFKAICRSTFNIGKKELHR